MISRLKNIKRKNTDGKIFYKNLKYPDIPITSDDLYVITTSGDRLDLLANEYYQDIGLWWIISTANPDVIRRDSFGLKPGIEIRIPANVQGIIEAVEALNK